MSVSCQNISFYFQSWIKEKITRMPPAESPKHKQAFLKRGSERADSSLVIEMASKPLASHPHAGLVSSFTFGTFGQFRCTVKL